jgi:hypothetical protein
VACGLSRSLASNLCCSTCPIYLSKEALKRNAIDELWRVKAATSAKSLGTVITSDAVMDQIRKELRRQTGHNMDPKELSDLIRSTVLRPEAL